MKMKKADLKELLKPIVEECIQESIYEALFKSGLVSTVVTEVVKGMNIPQLVEDLQPRLQTIVERVEQPSSGGRMSSIVRAEAPKNQLETADEAKKRRATLEENMTRRFGMNLLENVTPISDDSEPGNPMAGQSPHDPGIDLRSIPGLNVGNFSSHINKSGE